MLYIKTKGRIIGILIGILLGYTIRLLWGKLCPFGNYGTAFLYTTNSCMILSNITGIVIITILFYILYITIYK